MIRDLLLFLALLLLQQQGPQLVSAQRPMPQWHYNSSRLNVGWFGSNVSGFENEAQMATISRYDMAIFGWQAFLDKTNYTDEAEQLVFQARRVKAQNPAMPVSIYLDMELAEPFQNAVSRAMFDPNFQDFWLRDRAGHIMTCNVFCRSMPGMDKEDPRCLAYYWNWFNKTAVDYYLNEYIQPLANRTGFDAVFFDGADEWMMQSRHTWKVASNVGSNRSDAEGLKVMIDMRVRTAELLAKYNKYPIISEHLGDTAPAQQQYISERMAHVGYFRYFEFFQPKQNYIEMLLNETQGKVIPDHGGVAHLPIMCRQFISRGLQMIDSIAAFMIVQGDYSYYSSSTGWFDSDWVWHKEYEMAVGQPLGLAVNHGGGIFTRAFSGCDVHVNCSGVGRGNCKGAITMK